MIEEGFFIRAIRGDFSLDEDCIKLFGIDRFPQTRTRKVALPLVLEKSKSTATVEPFAHIERRCAQKLMDDLWDCGLRPSEGTGSAGQLRATQNHLADIKKVAFKMLKIEN